VAGAWEYNLPGADSATWQFLRIFLMRPFLASLFTGVVASLLTLWLVDARRSTTAEAQSPAIGTERSRAPSTPIPRKVAPGLFDERGLTPEEVVNVSVYENCNRSVVNISTVTVMREGIFRVALPAEGAGSGAIISTEGHILTNHHVIEGAKRIQVTLYNGESFAAKLVGTDPVNDIAVIQIEAAEEDLFPVELGDSDQARVGMRVFALGNPFGLERTMSLGIISSLNRTLEIQENWVIKSIIQIDASINPGNSGGPLLDSHGKMIGINTAIASRVAQSAGIGFVIPINLVKRVVPELLEHGHVVRGDIGITHVEVVEDGLRVYRLEPKGAAALAGLKGPKISKRGSVRRRRPGNCGRDRGGRRRESLNPGRVSGLHRRQEAR
jgi:S1-C subfamily serine protease